MWRLLLALLAVVPTCHASSLPLSVEPSSWLESMRQDLEAGPDAARAAANDEPHKHQGSALTNNRQHRLIVPLYIGTPPQRFNMLVDTRGSTTWIVDESCDASDKCAAYCYDTAFCDLICPAKCCDVEELVESTNPPDSQCDALHRFSSASSKSYKKGDTDWIAFYGGNAAYGFTGVDTVQIGSDEDHTHLNLTAAQFGQANQINGSMFLRDTSADGVLGLNAASSDFSGPASLLDQAQRAGKLKDWIYSIYTDASGRHGALTLDVDPHNCKQPSDWINSNKAWQFAVTRSQVRPADERQSAWTAMLDVSQPTIKVPAGVMDDFIKATKASYSAKYGAWFVSCDTQLLWHFFTGSYYTLTQEELISEIVPGTCVLKVQSSTNDDPAAFIFGAPLLSRFCIAFDAHSSRFQLALKQHS